MEIVSKTEGSKVTMEITGWLDTQTAPQLEKELSALDPGTTSLVFDFANLEYGKSPVCLHQSQHCKCSRINW